MEDHCNVTEDLIAGPQWHVQPFLQQLGICLLEVGLGNS